MTSDDTDGGTAAGTPAPMTPDAADELFRSALRWVLLFLSSLAVVSTVVGALVSGWAGVWGALLGVAIAVVFSGTTVWSMWYTSRVSPTAMVAVVAGSWALKIVVLFVATAVLHGMDFYTPGVLVVVILVGVLGSLVIDLVSFQRARVPYVGPT